MNHLKKFIQHNRYSIKEPKDILELINAQQEAIKEHRKKVKAAKAIDSDKLDQQLTKPEAPTLLPYGDKDWSFWRNHEVNLQNTTPL